jgi:hypothetical protein
MDMDIIQIVQQKLDNVLYRDGILSHHIRRVDVEAVGDGSVAINTDAYVVFRIVSNNPRRYGDGKLYYNKIYVDVNYYYKYEKTDTTTRDVMKRIEAIKAEFLKDPLCRLANDVTDIPDVENPYRGFNIEFMFFHGVEA